MIDPDTWRADAAEAALAWQTTIRRLAADLARFPNSPTLNGMAIRDDDGRVSGYTPRGDALSAAWLAGAPVEVIVEAENLADVIGSPVDPGFELRAIRLQWRVRAVNARLKRYSGLQSMTLLTVVSRWSLPLAERLAVLELAELAARTPPPAAHGPPTGTPALPSNTDQRPHLRRGPPLRAPVRPRHWLATGRPGSTLLQEVAVPRA